MVCWTSSGLALRSAVTSICLVWLIWSVSWTTVGWTSPADSAAVVASLTVRVDEVTSQDWPPLKSMPRLRPCTLSEITPSRMTMAEARNHQPPSADEIERGLAPVEADEDVVGLFALVLQLLFLGGEFDLLVECLLQLDGRLVLFGELVHAVVAHAVALIPWSDPSSPPDPLASPAP